jgi:hypothetical protein
MAVFLESFVGFVFGEAGGRLGFDVCIHCDLSMIDTS